MEAITYEAYVRRFGLIIEVLPTTETKHLQEKSGFFLSQGYSLAGIGSATWAFKKENGEWFRDTVAVSGAGTKLRQLIEKLEENDEVQDVYRMQE